MNARQERSGALGFWIYLKRTIDEGPLLPLVHRREHQVAAARGSSSWLNVHIEAPPFVLTIVSNEICQTKSASAVREAVFAGGDLDGP